MSGELGQQEKSDDRDRSLRGTVGAISLIALAGLAIWVLASDRAADRTPEVAGPFDGARLVSHEAAGEIARSTGHPVFWAGRIPGLEIAMNHDSRMNVHVRYLPEGVDPETTTDDYLSIGSYPYERAFEATARLAGEAGRAAIELPNGVGFLDRADGVRIVLALRSHPDLQVEVLHSRPEEALAVVRRGGIVPIE